MLSDKSFDGIYQALDMRQYKLANQLCTKLLKRTPASQLARSLKAYSLFKERKVADSLQIISAFEREGIKDAAAIQPISLVLESLNMEVKLAELLERAYLDCSQSEEIANQYFMCLVRHQFNNTAKLKQLAMKMWAQFKSEQKYCFWACFLAMTEANGDKNDRERNLKLTFAEKILSRLFAEGNVKCYEHFWLYVQVKQLLGQYEEILGLLDTETAKNCMRISVERQGLRMSLLLGLKKRELLANLATVCIEERVNDWTGYRFLLDGLKLDDPSAGDSSARYKQTADVIAKALKVAKSQNPISRAPFLAQFELFQQTSRDRRDPRRAMELLVEFFRYFGDQLSFFADVRPFLADLFSLSSERAPDLQTLLNDHAISNLKELKVVVKLNNLWKIQSFFETSTFKEPELFLARVPTLLATYRSIIPLGSNLEKVERQPGDDLLLIATNHLVAAWSLNRADLTPLKKAAVILETGLRASPHHFHLCLLLMRVYLLLGAQTRVFELLDVLDMKQVQLDSLSYSAIEFLGPLGLSSYGLQRMNSVLAIYAANKKETPEMLCQAFKFGTFSAIDDFKSLHHRLNNSVQRLAAVIQCNFYALIWESEKYTPNSDEVRSMQVAQDALSFDPNECLADNRDWSVFFSLCETYSIEELTRPRPLLISGPTSVAELDGEGFFRMQFSALVTAWYGTRECKPSQLETVRQSLARVEPLVEWHQMLTPLCTLLQEFLKLVNDAELCKNSAHEKLGDTARSAVASFIASVSVKPERISLLCYSSFLGLEADAIAIKLVGHAHKMLSNLVGLQLINAFPQVSLNKATRSLLAKVIQPIDELFRSLSSDFVGVVCGSKPALEELESDMLAYSKLAKWFDPKEAAVLPISKLYPATAYEEVNFNDDFLQPSISKMHENLVKSYKETLELYAELLRTP